MAPPLPSNNHSPGFRNLVHGGVFFAVGLPLMALFRIVRGFETLWFCEPYLPYAIAAFCAFGAFFNAFVMPHIPLANRMVRTKDGADNGLWIYPGTLAVCFLIFKPFAAFATWAVMACGDAPASFFGRIVSRFKLPWNAKKTFAGTIAFFFFALWGAYLSLWLMPGPYVALDGKSFLGFAWALAVVAALAGALAESVDTRLDDNLRVPLCAGAAIHAAVYFFGATAQNLTNYPHIQPRFFVHALIANALLGAGVLLMRFADLPATLLGMALGMLIYFFAGWQGYLLFGLFVGIGSFLSKMGLKEKKASGTAEANEGKRGIANVVANLLVPALCCALFPIFAGRPSLLMAFAGSIAAALADTASSEIGVLSPHEPLLITTLKKVPHGTNGAISLLGTAAAFTASLIIAVMACATGFIRLAAGTNHILSNWAVFGASAAIFFAGMFGTLVDSLLGATLEDKVKYIGKGAVNFACTLTGALVAGIATEVWIGFFSRG